MTPDYHANAYSARRLLRPGCLWAIVVLAILPSISVVAQQPAAAMDAQGRNQSRANLQMLFVGTQTWHSIVATGPVNRQLVTYQSAASCERSGWDDKRRHFILSTALTTTSYLMLRKGFGASRNTALVLSVSAAAAIGYGKELWDTKHGSPPCFSKRDLIANAAGILAATGIILILD